MRVRIALKIFKAVGEYSGWERFDMPYLVSRYMQPPNVCFLCSGARDIRGGIV